MGVVLRAHPVRGESHIQRSASGEVATHPTKFWMIGVEVLTIPMPQLEPKFRCLETEHEN